MKLSIPENFPIEHFKLKWSIYKQDCQKNMLDTLYIILNEFCRNNLYSGWITGVPLNNEAFRAVCGKNFDKVKKDLIVFEKGEVFYTDGSYDPGFKSKWYKLAKKYCYSEIIEVELTSHKRLKKYLNYLGGNRSYKKEIFKPEKKLYLEKQFKNLDISIDENIYIYRDLYISRIREIINSTNTLDVKFLYYAEIGKISEDINRLKNPIYYTGKISETNLRFNSIFTNIKRELRSFIRHNGNKFIEFDIVASHCYVLSTILNHEFFFNKTNEYSLKKIYPDLLNRIESYIDAANNYNSNSYSIAQEAAGRRVYHHMSDRFFENDDILLYKTIDFESDFYGFLGDVYKSINPNLPNLTRDKIKSLVRLWMNFTDPHKRIKVKSLNFLQDLFPSIGQLIEEIGFFKSIKSSFSLLLQRAEAHLVLDILGKKIIDRYPYNRIFTIHDSFLIEDCNICPFEVVSSIKDTLYNYTGIRPGVKKKEIDPFDSIEDILKEDAVDIRRKIKKDESRIYDINDRIFNPQTIQLVEKGIQVLNQNFNQNDDYIAFNIFLNERYSL